MPPTTRPGCPPADVGPVRTDVRHVPAFGGRRVRRRGYQRESRPCRGTVPSLAAMRVLFVTLAASPHFFVQAPLAWALRAAGHEVRVASQPDLMDTITAAGLPATPVGPRLAQDESVEELRRRQEKAAERLTEPPDAQDDADGGGPARAADPRLPGRAVHGDDLGHLSPSVPSAATTAASIPAAARRSLACRASSSSTSTVTTRPGPARQVRRAAFQPVPVPSSRTRWPGSSVRARRR